MDIRGSTNAELDMPRLSLSADYRSVGSWTTYLLLTMFRRNTITLRMIAYYITMYKVIEGFKLNLRAQIIRHRS